jgi:hypothetical protein
MIGFAVQATAIAVLALVALILLGRRPSSGPGTSPHPSSWADDEGVAVEQLPTRLYRRPNPLRRLFAAATTSAIAVITGVVIAVLLAFGAVYAVVTVTGLLDR